MAVGVNVPNPPEISQIMRMVSKHYKDVTT